MITKAPAPTPKAAAKPTRNRELDFSGTKTSHLKRKGECKTISEGPRLVSLPLFDGHRLIRSNSSTGQRFGPSRSSRHNCFDTSSGASSDRTHRRHRTRHAKRVANQGYTTSNSSGICAPCRRRLKLIRASPCLRRIRM